MRRDCKYAKDAREEFNAGRFSSLQLIQTVWDIARKKGIESHVVENSTKDFSLLTKKYGNGVWISWQIKYKYNLSDGLWPWLNTGSDIIEENPVQKHEYRVRNQFFEDFIKVI